LLDIKMPGVGGLDVLEWVQENMSEVPAIMLTSSELLEDRLRARDLGSKGYFEKSATFSEIIEFLRDWETQRSLAPDPDLARCASRAADEAASTAKENKALSFVRELRAPDPFYGTPVSFTRTDSTAC
jgi:DNA-binding response OmpR family regulator